jgi:tRNA threonylcarbamoyladenosine biosynthesis protein TsaB
VSAALDAGRGEVYFGQYEVVKGSAQRLNEQLLPVARFLSVAQGSTVLTMNQPLAEIAQNAGLPVTFIEAVNAEMIARLGRKKLRAGETATPEGLEANYIRRTDAEIFAKPQ